MYEATRVVTDKGKVCLFGGFVVLRDVIHDNSIRRPKGRGKQVGSEGVSTRKCPLGVLPWELIKSGSRVLHGTSYPSVTLPYNTGLLVRLVSTAGRATNLSNYI